MNTLPRCTHLSSLAGAIITLLVVAAPGPCAAQTAVLTVGPHGTYPTIQGALGSVVNGWVNEVRVESGLYAEHVVIEDPAVTLTSGELHLSGGWNSTFSSQTADPEITLIDGEWTGRCLWIKLIASAPITITISNLTLYKGFTDGYGGGLHFETVGNVRLDLVDVELLLNRASGGGGGLWAYVYGAGNRLGVARSRFYLNFVETGGTGNVAFGGGAYVEISGISPVEFKEVTFQENYVQSSSLEAGAGLAVRSWLDSLVSIVDCRFLGNTAYSSTGTSTTVRGIAVNLDAPQDTWVVLRRVVLNENRSLLNIGSQLRAYMAGSSLMWIGEVLADNGNGGLELVADGSATIQATNVTSAYNTGVGLALDALSPTASGTIHNSIFFGNDVNFNASGPVTGGHLLDGVDPLFIDPGLRNYRLGPGSPAANAGTNSPAAGLGDADLDGGVRVLDGLVDIGAYEGVGVLFSDAFATRDTHRWTATVGAAP